MCGIFGLVNLQGEPADSGLVRKMGDAITHRGPDDAGYYSSGPVGMGMRRLSIIDLKGGHQPIFNEDRTAVIVFNGEIYNFRELKADLEKNGHRFSTQSDTEAILHLYEEKGERCVDDLLGMFAFAIWDIKKSRLFLARDRFGEKPLHYYMDRRRFMFASEMKSILCDRDADRTLDWESVNDYFTFMNTMAPHSVFEKVKKVLPGHTLVFEGGAVRQERYWRYPVTPGEDRGKRFFSSSLLEHLKVAVESKLVSEVPLGAFLSGGIDSSAVVALMSMAAGRVRTFSIGFEEKGYDELGYAREVSQRFGTEHSEYVVKPDAVDAIDDIIWHLDEPFADPSAIPTYFVSKMAKRAVTVALSGDGGDELFGGYSGYRAEYPMKLASLLPKAVRAAFSRHVLGRLTSTGRAGLNYRLRRLGRILDRVDMTPQERFMSRHSVFGPDERVRLFMPAVAGQMGARSTDDLLEPVLPRDEKDAINLMLLMDANLYLPNDMLVKVDRMSMAHSLEVRAPFLDHRLAEFVGSIPSRYKVRRMKTKYIFKEAMRGILPDSIIDRQKMGFSVPLDIWFRNDMAAYAAEILLDPSSVRRGFFNMDYVREILALHSSKKEDRSFQIWALVVFEKWCRLFLDGERVV